MSKVDIMIGIIGSGKSTLAKELAAENGATILSSDAIRKELFDGGRLAKEHGFESNQIVFAELHRRLEELLKNNRNVIIDGVNTVKRENYFAIIRRYDCYVTGRLLLTDKKICIQRVIEREKRDPNIHKVKDPERVAFFSERAIRNNFPSLDEGFDELVIYKNNVVSSVEKREK